MYGGSSFESYKNVTSNMDKTKGSFRTAFGECARLSSFTLTYEDGSKYEIGSSGYITRPRGRNPMTDRDEHPDREIARDACRLMKSSKFVDQTLTEMNEKQFHIGPKDISGFSRTLESRYGIRDKLDSLTSKLMS